MTKTAERALWVVGAIAVAGAVGGGVYLATRPAQAAPASNGGGGGGGGGTQPVPQTQQSLLPGHEYKLTVTDPSVATLPPDFSSSVQTGFDRLFGKGILAVKSVAVTGITATVIFDYLGATAIPVTTKSFDVPKATLTDLGMVQNPQSVALASPPGLPTQPHFAMVATRRM